MSSALIQRKGKSFQQFWNQIGIGSQECTWWSILSFPSISLVVLGVGDLDDGVVAHDNQKAIVFLETDIIGVCKDTKTKSNHFELDKVLSN